MWLVLYIVAMQCALALQGLAVCWRKAVHRSSRSAIAAVLSAACFGIAMTALAFWRAWDASLTLYYHAVAGIVLLFALAHVADCRRSRLLPGRVGWFDYPWLAGSMAIQLTLLVTASQHVGYTFAHMRLGEYHDPTVPPPLLALALGLQVATGGFLALTVLAGLRQAWHLADTGESFARHVPFDHTLKWVLTALTIRVMAIVFALITEAAYTPLGYRHLVQGLLRVAPTLIVTRLTLGIGLPVLLVGLSQMALAENGSRAAGLHFMPLILLVLFGEICAATMTAGYWGVAF